MVVAPFKLTKIVDSSTSNWKWKLLDSEGEICSRTLFVKAIELYTKNWPTISTSMIVIASSFLSAKRNLSEAVSSESQSTRFTDLFRWWISAGGSLLGITFNALPAEDAGGWPSVSSFVESDMQGEFKFGIIENRKKFIIMFSFELHF